MNPLLRHGFSPHFVGEDGSGSLGVLVVGEAPGKDEDFLRKPLVGPSGKLFDRMLQRVKDPTTGQPFTREQFLLSNVVHYRPPDNELAGKPWEHEAVEYCRPHLEDVLRARKPKAILAMGATAIKWFIPHAVGTRELVKDWRGYATETKWGPVIPTYHPAFLLRGNFALCEPFQHDLVRAVQVSRSGLHRSPVSYIERPNITQASKFLSDYRATGGLLAFDIETPYSEKADESDLGEEYLIEEDDPSYTIVRISFSFRENTAISMPWSPPYVDIARALLASEGPKAVWNEVFDVPRLEANGITVSGGIRDYMLAWHQLKPALPYGLKYAASLLTDLPQWKHESHLRPEWYSCVDADATIRCAAIIERELRREGRWDVFERHFVRVGGILRKMGKIGVRVDQKRRKEVRDEMILRQEGVGRKLNALVPGLRPRKQYKLREETLRKKGLLETGEWEEWNDGAPEPVEKPNAKRKRTRGPKHPGGVP